MVTGSLAERLERIAGRSTCRLTHRGRKSGKTYQVTIWFVVEGERLYLATANAERQWVRNVRHDPRIAIEAGGDRLEGTIAELTDAADARRVMDMVGGKYWYLRPTISVARVLGFDPTPDASFVVRFDAPA
jgi:deazaflavin-dependent oxidoreductase (nitroreductase family)